MYRANPIDEMSYNEVQIYYRGTLPPWNHMSAVFLRKFGEETIQFLGKKVSVETSDSEDL